MHDQELIPALINETEAARILDLSVKTLRRWRWAGQGPRFVKVGTCVRYAVADLAGVHRGRPAPVHV